MTRLIEPHRPARPVRRDVDVRLRVAARRSGPASAAHDLSRGGRPRPRRCAIPDSQRGVSPRCASSGTTRPTRSGSPAPPRPRFWLRGPTRGPWAPPLGFSTRPRAPSALGGLAPPPLVAPSPLASSSSASEGEARNSLNLYQLAQNNTYLFETARGFKLDIPSIGVHRPSVFEQSSEVLRLLVFELGLHLTFCEVTATWSVV